MGQHKVKNRILALLITSLLLFITSSCSTNKQPETPYINFTAQTAEGNEIQLSDYIGKSPVVVTFWASWCPDCQQELPYLYNLQQQYAQQNITFIMVNSTSGDKETEEKALSYLKNNNLDFSTNLLDVTGEACSAYNVYFIPTTILINKQGNIVKRFDDIVPEKELQKEIAALLKT